jgi:hypothetical protein
MRRMREYGFAEAVTLSGASPSELKNWIQKATIRPDVHDTKVGTGDHRVLGFLDLFDGKIGTHLNRIPGGIPSHSLSNALTVLRFHTQFFSESWRQFLLNPATRDPNDAFWFVYTKTDPWTVVVGAADLSALLQAATDTMIVVPLHRLLLELEAATGDHCSTDEADRVWDREKPRSKKQREAVERQSTKQSFHHA